MKRILPLALALLLLLTALVSCGGTSYRNDLSSAEVMNTVLASVPLDEGYRQVSDSFVSESSFGAQYTVLLENSTDYYIAVSEKSDMNVDEIGVFHVKNGGKVEDMKAIVSDYITARTRQYEDLLVSYNPEELPKLEEATVMVCGNYIYYSILSESRTATAKNAFEDAVTEK